MNILSRLKNFSIYHISKFKSTLISFLSGDFKKQNAIITSWGRKNFGDLMTPILIKHLGFTPINTWYKFSEVVLVGSVLDALDRNYSGIIFGSGFLKEVNGKPFPKANVIAVRGKLTSNLMNLPSKTLLGDPGLLFSKIFKPSIEKKYKLGIIPHYSDLDKTEFKRILLKNNDEITLINVKESVLDVFYKISQCENIISSSLHGLVIADSLKIPNRWCFVDGSKHNDRFKFDDYYSAFCLRRDPFIINNNITLKNIYDCLIVPPKEVLQVTDVLYKRFINLSNDFNSL
nr:polysaccharide pyruvyl transferase family protein [uncultured Algoriphagus sp.]